MGILVVTTYNVILVGIGKQQSFTCLPLCSNPPPPSQKKEMMTRFVNDNHFVQVLNPLITHN